MEQKKITKKGYDWDKKKRIQDILRERRRVEAGADGYIPNKEVLENAIKEEKMKFHKKVISTYHNLKDDDIDVINKIITETQDLKPRDRIIKRRTDLYPLYRKYVDPNARLNTGCGSCVRAQSQFFEQLIGYHNEQKTK